VCRSPTAEVAQVARQRRLVGGKARVVESLLQLGLVADRVPLDQLKDELAALVARFGGCRPCLHKYAPVAHIYAMQRRMQGAR
jgi:hypothetical protein